MIWFRRKPWSPPGHLWRAAGFAAPMEVAKLTADQLQRARNLLLDAAVELVCTPGVAIDARWWCELDAEERLALRVAIKQHLRDQALEEAFAANREAMLTEGR